MAYEIDPNDERLVAVNREEEQTLNNNNTMYNSMIADSDEYYKAQIDASKEWASTQAANQQAQTDFAIEEINQQKEQAEKDYKREQSGAYVDWQKQSNQYGANAEQMAAQGLANTGYSESSQVSMYNTYQNRVATARESYQRAVLNYDNAIQEARLQNNSVLAEIAYQAQQTQLELSLQGFQYKNQLLETQANRQLEIKGMYHSEYMDVLNQINTENRLQEELRQFNASHALQQQQLAQQKEIAAAQLAEEQRQFNILHSSSGSGSKIGKSSGGSSGGSNVRGTGKNAVYAVNKDDTGNASGNNKVTMQSILALGYGPLSAKGLEELVAKGLVKESTDKNGNTVFKKAGPINDYERLRLYQGLKSPTKTSYSGGGTGGGSR